MDEDSDERDGPMAAERVSFEIQVECVLEGGMEERKGFSSGTEEMRVGVKGEEVVMLSGWWQCEEAGQNEGSAKTRYARTC